MKVRYLHCACGAAIALTTLAAHAQQSQPSRDNRPDSARQPSDTKPRSTSQQGRESAPDVLQKLEGVWKVEVAMNPHLMPNDKSGHANKSQAQYGPGAKPAHQDQPTDRPTEVAASPVMQMCDGYAERKLVLGDNILQESIVIPKLGTTKDERQSTSLPDYGEPQYRGMSFLSFNEPTGTYRIVFMDSMCQDMHIDSGVYDASQRKINFYGTQARGTPSSPRETRPGTKIDPADFSRQPAPDQRSLMDRGDVRVVLEIVSEDRHQVTMYRNTGTGAANPPAESTGRPQPADQSGDKNSASVPIDAEAIVYRAVYTRATGAEATRYQRLIDEDQSLTRANRTDR